MKGYTPVPFPGYAGGLNLRDQPNQVDPSHAIDLLNVTFTELGAVKSRDGFAALTASPLTNQPDSCAVFYTTGGTKQLMVGNGNKLSAVATDGSVVASSTAPTANPHFFTRFGGATSTGRMYISNGTDEIRSWDGSSFAAWGGTGTSPTGKFLAVTPWDNRLVCARYSGSSAGSNPSTVRFSGAGDPATFGANDYVDLTPGDGEEIKGIIAWQRYLFVFKETKFFFFHSTTIDTSGNPVFRYETVDTGIGACSPKAITANRDGVYFLNQKGVYRTTSSPPVLASEVIDPFFYGSNVSDFYLGQVFNQAQLSLPAMAFHNEQLYVAVPTGGSTTNDRMLVFDPRHGWWTLYDIGASCLASFKVGSSPELVFGYATGANDVGRHSPSYTLDVDQTITSRWRSGWWDFGVPLNKTIRETKAWGKGTVRLGVGSDFAGARDASTLALTGDVDYWEDGTGSDTWGDGSDPTNVWSGGVSLEPKLSRIALRGTVFSLELTNADASPWTVYRSVYNLRNQRFPTLLKTENSNG